jgi:hypothetical protein
MMMIGCDFHPSWQPNREQPASLLGLVISLHVDR